MKGNAGKLAIWIAGIIICGGMSPLQGQQISWQDSLDKALHLLYDDPEYTWETSHWVLENVSGSQKKWIQAEANRVLGNFHSMITGDLDSLQFHYFNAISIYKELGKDTSNQAAQCYQRLSEDYEIAGEIDVSFEYIFEAINRYEALENYEYISYCLTRVCNLYYSDRNFERAITYALQAEKILEEHGPEEDLMFVYEVLSPAYRGAGMFDQALEVSNKLIELAKIRPDWEKKLYDVYSRRGLVYKAVGEYEKALADFQHAYALAEASGKPGVEYDLSAYRINIASVYTLQERADLALPYLHKALEYEEQSVINQNRVSLYFQLANAYDSLGRYKETSEYLSLMSMAKDTLHNLMMNSMESELQVKYETEKKESLIASQESVIAQQRQIQLLSFGLAALFALLLGGLFVSFQRNRKINRQLQKLNLALEDKNQQNELLLKEIHHRVKNNLQTISSLLRLQSAHIEDPDVQNAMDASQNRVRSMALIHQKLYQRENLAAIEISEYLQSLGESIEDTYGEAAAQIQIKYEVSSQELDVDTAIPLGLIANELLVNSYKYAFPTGQGAILLSLKKLGEHFQFTVSDNGVGHSKENRRGFGSQLIDLLVLQIGGQLEKFSSDGTSTTITFPVAG